MVADDRRLDHVAAPHPASRPLHPRQRGEAGDRSVPAHDLGVGLIGPEAAPEDLVAGAGARADGAAQGDLALLEVVRGLGPAEDGRLHALVRAPRAGQHRGRVVVVAFRRRVLRCGTVEIALLRPTLRDPHPDLAAVRATLLGDNIGPVDTICLAVGPHPALGDRVLGELEPGTVRTKGAALGWGWRWRGVLLTCCG